MGTDNDAGAAALLSSKQWGRFYADTVCETKLPHWIRDSLFSVRTQAACVYPGRRNLHKAINALFITFSVVTPLNFVFCANAFNSRHRALKEAFSKNNIKQAQQSHLGTGK